MFTAQRLCQGITKVIQLAMEMPTTSMKALLKVGVSPDLLDEMGPDLRLWGDAGSWG